VAIDFTASPSELVEHEQRMVAGAAENAPCSTAFLLAIGLALLESILSMTILGRRRCCTLSIHWPDKSARAARFSGQLSHFVSKRPIWLAEAADPVIAVQPVGVIHVFVSRWLVGDSS
jgi:hypothetical protein